MEKEPLISIIIPAFNYAKYLPHSVQSIINQTYKNWECIVVDDGSTDNTVEVMEQLAKKDSRIKYHQQKNSGPTVARNLGVKLAAGSFIQFLDADDLLEDKKLEVQLKKFQRDNTIDVVYGGAKYFDHNKPGDLFDNLDLKPGKSRMPCVSGSGDALISALLRSNLMVISSPLVKKTLFDKYGAMDESLYFNEDWELWLRFAVNGANYLFLEEADTNVKVRVHGSYSRDNFKMFVNGLMVCIKYDNKLTDHKYKKVLRPKINYHTKVIDRKILDILKSDKQKAVEMCKYVYQSTLIKRYKKYISSFDRLPFWLCSCASFFNTALAKLSGLIKYGA